MIADGWRGEGAVLFGGSGFVGTSILRLFPEMISAGRTAPWTGNRHIAVADLGDLGALRDVAFDRVISCVGTSRHVELMEQPLTEALEKHMMPSVRLLEQLRERPLRSFVRLSTVLLYDETRAEMPVSETSPIDPYRNRYLLSQYLGEQAAHYYARYFPVATVRLCNLFGPWAGERTDIVHEVVAQLRRDGRATVRTRAPERDFLFVKDAARALGAMAFAGVDGVFNLGAGEPVAVGRIVDVLSALSGCPVASKDEPGRGAPRIWVDASKLRAATGWAPVNTLEEALAKTWRAGDAAGN